MWNNGSSYNWKKFNKNKNMCVIYLCLLFHERARWYPQAFWFNWEWEKEEEPKEENIVEG